ncbi:unnamed protein product, partial [Hapterophycus canaliculatus]
QGKDAQAEELYERCQTVEEKCVGPEHPSVATTLDTRARLLQMQGKYDEAQPLYERAIVIWEASLGSDHAQVATGLSDLAGTLFAQVQAIRIL